MQAQPSAQTPAKRGADPACVPDTPDSQPLPCPSVPDTPASDSMAPPEEAAEAPPQLRFDTLMGTLEGYLQPQGRSVVAPRLLSTPFCKVYDCGTQPQGSISERRKRSGQ